MMIGCYVPISTANKQCCSYCKHFLIKVKRSVSTLLHSAYCQKDKNNKIPLHLYVPGDDCLQNGCSDFKPSGKPLALNLCPAVMGFNQAFDEQIIIDQEYNKKGIDFLYDPDYPTNFETI